MILRNKVILSSFLWSTNLSEANTPLSSARIQQIRWRAQEFNGVVAPWLERNIFLSHGCSNWYIIQNWPRYPANLRNIRTAVDYWRGWAWVPILISLWESFCQRLILFRVCLFCDVFISFVSWTHWLDSFWWTYQLLSSKRNVKR